MKNVLIVSPNWPPVSCPDLHRVRMALPYFAEFGWEPLILKIDPNEQEGIKDPDLCRTVLASTRTWQSGCLPLPVLRWIGVRNVGLRSYFHLARLGDRIIREQKPDVVFFSTTMFPLMTVGRYWHRRHNVPYVLDYQDPWTKDKERGEGRQEKEVEGRPSPPSPLPPDGRGIKGEGVPSSLSPLPSVKTSPAAQFQRFSVSASQLSEGAPLSPLPSVTMSSATQFQVSGFRFQHLKRRLAALAARSLEPIALRHVSHVVSVSPAYVTMLCRRYPWLTESMFTVLPFGAAERDYEVLRTFPTRQTVFDPKDGKRHWLYVGRGGKDMALGLRALFRALARVVESQPELRKNLRLHFVGTDYAPAGRATKTVEPLAREAGLSDIVEEKTDRLPYFEALQCLLDAEALIVPGSDDPGYTASKIYPDILACKPLLAIFHEQSSVVDVLRKTNAGTVVSFRSDENVGDIASRITATRWLQELPTPLTNWAAFAPFTAREMTRKLCSVFDQACGKGVRSLVGSENYGS